MKFSLHILCKKILVISLVAGGFITSALAVALESNRSGSTELRAWTEATNTQRQSRFEPTFESVNRSLRWAKNDKQDFRSKGEVMSEVKDRYNAKVLRISLNKKSEVYNIRILLPSGKVKNIQLSARR